MGIAGKRKGRGKLAKPDMAAMQARIAQELRESINAKTALMRECVPTIYEIADRMATALSAGHAVYLMGNGGSAADAQHIAGELVGRFKKERKALPAVAFTTDTSILTSIGNDYGFDQCFVRQVEALAKPGDVVVGFSTSGNSVNVVKALALARKLGAVTVGFTGADGGKMKTIADVCLRVPSTDTPRIQECHITVAHILCGLVEEAVCG